MVQEYMDNFLTLMVVNQVEFQINSFTSGDQKLASAIELSNGNIIVSWTSDGQDGSGTGVFAKILAPHKVTLKGVKDNYSDSNGSENVSISTGLQAHINSTFPSSSTVPFDNNTTNSIRGVSFDLSDKRWYIIRYVAYKGKTDR